MTKTFSILLGDLWKSAIFDPDSYALLEKIVHRLATSSNREVSIKELENDKELFLTLTTIRNRNLITALQQKELQRIVVACFGLSVGSHAIITWMMEARANRVKILDPDTIDPSNLNRLRFGWGTVGRKKSDVVKEILLEINPHAEIISFSNKIEMETMFAKPRVDCVIDAIDDIEGKIFLRRKARELKIPLISAADVGDNVILDVERYDLKPMPKLFLGRITENDIQNISNLSSIERRNLIIKLVGFQSNSEPLLSSLQTIGKTLPTWPQLGATASIAGGVMTTVIKKIFLKEKLLNGRYIISLDQLLDKSYESKERKSIRARLVTSVKKRFSL